MRASARVHPRSSREEIVEFGKGAYKVYLHQPAYGGKANKRLIEMWAEYFDTEKYKVRISSGLRSRNKIIEWVE